MALVRKVSLRKLDPPVKETFHDFADTHDVYGYQSWAQLRWNLNYAYREDSIKDAEKSQKEKGHRNDIVLDKIFPCRKLQLY